MKLLKEVFNEYLPRQGPGDNESTKKAFSYLSDLPLEPSILDIGCGVGMQTLQLAQLTDGNILALDNHQPYLNQLQKKSKAIGLTNKITIIKQSMMEMNFKGKKFDIIWSEGAAFVYGVEKAFEDWQGFLKDKGYIVISDLCWFKENSPKEIQDYLMAIDPAIKTIKEIIEIIKNKGLKLISHFNLPESSWWENLYHPLEKSIEMVRKKYQKDEEALRTLNMFSTEIEMFRNYSDYYGYTFFITKKN